MRKVLLLFTFALSLCALSSCQSQSRAQQIELVQNGVASAQIVIGTNASSTEKYVADDLQRVIQKISGAELPIKNTIDKSTFNVVIGTPQSIPEIKSANLLKTDNPETVRIASQGKVLFMAGNKPASALRAVYTFLQERLDCRWYWPGKSGEYLPSLKTISIKDVDVTETPDIGIRSLAINAPHWDKDTMIWMSRNRMNWHTLQGATITEEHIADLHEKGIKARVGGHNITLPEKLLNEHPEYRALWGGKRQGDQLCWGNPDVQNAVAQKVIDWWKDNPEIDGIAFMAADNTHFCDDKLCQILAPDVSTRWQKFCENVINKVNKTYPGKDYQSLAYQNYRNVPTNVAPFGFIAYATYNINYTKPITDPSNIKARMEIEAWQKLGGNMGIRGYQFIPFDKSMYAPIEPLIVQEIAWAHKIGLKGWYSELRPYGYPQGTLPQDENWVTHRMALYAVAQAMWNSQIDPTSITQDWTEHIYGVASAPMLDYYATMQNAWVDSPKALSYFLQPPASFVSNFISYDLLNKADSDFQKARADLSNIKDTAAKERIETQINLEAAMLDNWRKVYLLQQGRADRFKTQAPLAITTPQVTANPADPAWKNIAPLPDFEDNKMQAAPDPTKVLLQWDNDALYLRFICEDKNISKLKINGHSHDSNVFGDDTIELFLNDPAQAGHYFHVAINAKNVSYDAKSDAAMNFDKSWNPKYESKTSIGAESWILDIKFPFSSFGIAAKEGVTWNMSFKRSGARRYPNTGWPDASYHNPAGFGTVEFVGKIAQQKRLLTYDSGNTHKDALLTAFRKEGFTVRDVAQDEEDFKSTFAKGADAISFLYPSTGGFQISDDTVRGIVVPFVKNGGLLLIAGSGGGRALQKWFGPDAAVKWDGWKIDPNRKSTFVADGSWQTVPGDLSKILKNGVTPASGFTPQSEKWEILGKIRMLDGSESAYLLRQKIGKGELVLTSSNFGYGGGNEMFGSANPNNAAMLLDNLLVAAQEGI